MLEGTIMEFLWRLYFFRNYGISFRQILSFLRKSQYWSREVMQQYQLTEMNKLLMLVQSSSPFYREYYRDQKIGFEKLCDTIKLPFLSKEEIRSNASLIRHKDRNGRFFEHSTSGSTGDPLVVYLNTEAEAFRIAGKYRHYEWWRIRPYDRSILIWAKKYTEKHERNVFSQAKFALRTSTIARKLFINVFDLSSASVTGYYQEALLYKPVYIYGYLSGVTQFAELLIEAGLNPSALNLQLVIVTSEILNQETREFLRNAFCCPIANEYGSAEAGLFAFDCPHGGMHIFEEGVLSSALEDGRFIVTELHNSHMPLINYINGDRVTISNDRCGCGRGSRLITEVHGRVSDYVLTVAGEKVSHYLFYYAVKELNDVGLSNAIRKYKVIQRGRTLEFFLVKDCSYNDRVLTYLSERIKKVLGNEIEIKFRIVSEIERDKSGKLRFFVQETPKHFVYG